MPIARIWGVENVDASLHITEHVSVLSLSISEHRIAELGWALDRALNCAFTDAPPWLVELSDMCNAAKEQS